MAVRFESFRHSVEGRITAHMERNLARAAYEWASEIPRLMAGPKSGRVYRVPGTSRAYRASAPGEAPARRRPGQLAASYGVEMPQATEARVGTEVDYGLHLERGTSKMRPRPALEPAFQIARPRIEAILREPIR